MNLPLDISDGPWLRPLQAADLPVLEALAAADNHAVIHPTHVFVKHGEIVGCVSLMNIALVLPWFHTEKCTARDSLYFINQLENLTANLLPAGGPGVGCVPFEQHSPFTPLLERLGYVNAGQFQLTFKKVR
jgi:hypothetical protein